MPDDKNTFPGSPARAEQEDDLFRIELRAPDQAALLKLMQSGPLDIGAIQPLLRGDILVDLFMTRGQAARLQAEGWKLEIFENVSLIGLERQKEVGLGDRFEGGKIAPKGLGKKVENGG